MECREALEPGARRWTRNLSDGSGAGDVQLGKPALVARMEWKMVLKSVFACSIALGLVCVGLGGCFPDKSLPELSADAGPADAAADEDANAETADERRQRPGPDGGNEAADAASQGAAPSGAMGGPGRAATDAGSRGAAEADKDKDKDAAKDQSRDAGTEPPRPSDAATPTGSPVVTAAQGEIETVMMYITYTIGVGGSPSPTPRPIILFKDGSATTDINFVVRNLDVATHKSMFPNTWTEWKVVDGKVARKSGMDWRPLDFQQKYPPNPSNLALDDAFQHLSGATVGETTAFTQRSVRFFADHKVLWGSVTGVTGPNVVFGSFPPDQRGTYQIDGYTIEFKWDDGKVTRSSFVWNEQDPGAVFIAGAGYVRLD